MFSPKRSCVACREKKSQNDFFKVVLKRDESIARLADGYCEGRGAYVCKNLECINLAEKKKAFNRSFRRAVGSDIYAKLKEALDDR